jgi:hypothetical protein
MPPSEETGEEARYIKALKEAKTALVVRLKGGEEVRGYIEYFDRDMIKITRPDGPHFFVRKDDICFLTED